jgi:hypothetical protein
MKLQYIAKKILSEAETSTELRAMDNAMDSSFKKLGAELKSNLDVIKKDVDNSNIEVKEEIGTVAIIGMLLAAPKVIELLAKGLSTVVKTYKKLFQKNSAQTDSENVEMAEKIIEFAHKWHKSYIKGLKWILSVTGIFDKANVKSDSDRQKAAEVLYYTIIAGLAVYSGVGAVSAFKTGLQSVNVSDFSISALESAMSTIKSAEVGAFIKKLGIV